MGLAGTVDLRTIRPLEYGKRAIAVNLRGQYDQGGGRNGGFSKYGWRGSASYIGQNKDGTLGWMIGYAHLDAPSHVDHTKNWYYEDYNDATYGDQYILSGQEIRASNARDIRDGVMGTVEWKPSDAVHTVLDVYYSRFKQHTVTSGAEWFEDVYTGDPRFLQQHHDGNPRRHRFRRCGSRHQCRSGSQVGRQPANRPSLLGGAEQ